MKEYQDHDILDDMEGLNDRPQPKKDERKIKRKKVDHIGLTRYSIMIGLLVMSMVLLQQKSPPEPAKIRFPMIDANRIDLERAQKSLERIEKQRLDYERKVEFQQIQDSLSK
ncbi:MAG: hypothetical protein GY810_15170 [Aureispira sp.]|nr:hypothetical protein [Aureispira sp.]